MAEKDTPKEGRRVKIPVTKLQALYLAVADLCDSGVVKEGIDYLKVGAVQDRLDAAEQLKDFFEEVEKAYDSVYQTHWGGEVYEEAAKTAEFLLAAEEAAVDDGAKQPVEQPDGGEQPKPEVVEDGQPPEQA